jgi:hypothetical protein
MPANACFRLSTDKDIFGYTYFPKVHMYDGTFDKVQQRSTLLGLLDVGAQIISSSILQVSKLQKYRNVLLFQFQLYKNVSFLIRYKVILLI